MKTSAEVRGGTKISSVKSSAMIRKDVPASKRAMYASKLSV
jgi:hypothetical protein